MLFASMLFSFFCPTVFFFFQSFCKSLTQRKKQEIVLAKCVFLGVITMKGRIERFCSNSAVTPVLLSLLFCLFTFGCQKTASKPPINLRLAIDGMPNPNHIPLYVGDTLGFFKEEGIILTLQPQAGDPLRALGKSEVELGLSYIPRVLRATQKDHHFLVVGRLVEKPLKGFLAIGSNTIKQPGDLTGRSLGYCAGKINIPMFEQFLAEKNAQAGCKLNVGEDLVSALIDKKVDIVYGALRNVQPFELEDKGYKCSFLLVTEFGVPDYEGMIVVANGDVKKKPKKMASFQKALQKSIDFCKQEPTMAFEIYFDRIKAKYGATRAWQEKGWTMTLPLLSRTQDFSFKRLKRLVDWLIERGIIYKPVNLSHLFYSLDYQEDDA